MPSTSEGETMLNLCKDVGSRIYVGSIGFRRIGEIRCKIYSLSSHYNEKGDTSWLEQIKHLIRVRINE